MHSKTTLNRRWLLVLAVALAYVVFLFIYIGMDSRFRWPTIVLAFLCIAYAVKLLHFHRKGRDCAGLVFLRTIRKYEFLMSQLISRDFKTKYKRSVLGIFWSFLNPLLMMMVQYVVFSTLMRMDIEHYAVYLLTGIVLFSGFNDCCNQALRAITGNASLITKVYVPKYIYPMSKVFSASINMVLSMVPLLLVATVNKVYPSWALLLLPVCLALLILFTLGMGFLLSSLMVFFHDVEFLWSVLSTIWMYATPIIYDLSIFTTSLDGKEPLFPWMAKLELFNPLYHYITLIRTLVIGRTLPTAGSLVACIAFAVLMLLAGGLVFRKTQDKFVLYI